MAKRVALVAPSDELLSHVRTILRNNSRITVREFLSLEDINQHLRDDSFDILLLCLPGFSISHVQTILKLRARFPTAALLTLARDIDMSARFQIRKVPGHKLLLDPAELRDLDHLMTNIGCIEQSRTRMHARVIRECVAELWDPSTGEKVSGRFLDFAQMGARLLLQSRTHLKKNYRLQLHYQSTSEPGKQHRIESIVVWETAVAGFVGALVNGPRQIIGLRFIAAL